MFSSVFRPLVNRRYRRHEGSAAPAARVRVTGRVGKSGLCGTRMRGENVWTVDLDLENWHIIGGRAQSEPLVVTYQCGDQLFPEIQQRLIPNSQVSFEIVFDAGACNVATLLSHASIRAVAT